MGARRSTADEDEIRKFIAERGVSKCPPKAARELGEASPSWRREVERKAERTDKGRARHQKALRDRAGFTGDAGEKTKG